MLEEIAAVYRDGVFIPEAPCHLPNNTRVHIIVKNTSVQAQLVSDPVERQRIVEETLARMKANPIPAGAPEFTREELHERR